MEAFDVSVQPWTARLDVKSLDPLARQPFAEVALDKLRSIVAADVFRGSVLHDQAGHHFLDFPSVDLAVHVDASAFSRILVHNGEHAQLAAPHRGVVDDVPGPHVIGMRSLGRKPR